MYCPSCGTQNDDVHKFCKKCGQPLPIRPAQQSSAAPKQVSSYSNPPAPPVNPVASAASVGGITSMLGGALIVVGWFMPWSKDFLTSTNGLQLTISGIANIFLGLGTLQYSGAAILLVLFGIVATLAYGAIPILGILNAKEGFNVFEDKKFSNIKALLRSASDKVQTRSRNGFILTAAIFLIPLIFSQLVQAILPAIYLLGNLLGKLIGSSYGMGIYVTALGFITAYVGARYTKSQIQISVDASTGRLYTEYSNLSETDKIIINGIAESLYDVEIAKRLGVSVAKYDLMVDDLFKKMNIKNRDELVDKLNRN